MPPSSADVVAAARSYVGAKWRHQGRSRAGIDCAGLIICVARDLRLADGFVDDRSYKRQPDGRTLHGLLRAHLDEVRRSEIRPGDVAEMRVVSDGYPQHLGIIADGPEGRLNMIHAWTKARRVFEGAFDPWRPNLVCAFRFRGAGE